MNVSARQLSCEDFPDLVGDILRESGLEGAYLELEITESCLIRDLQTTTHTLDSIKELGVRVAVDDFGIGFSSLSVLGRLPLKDQR